MAAASESEVIAIYPHRSDVPRETWVRLFDTAAGEIGILVYAGMFLAEDASAQRLLMAKARSGVRVRVLLESLVQAGVRETREETGVDCEITGLVGIYTDPKHVIFYTSDGEARQEFSVVFTARATGGAPSPGSESTEVRWKDPAELAELPMDRSMRMRIDHFLSPAGRPHLG